MRQLRSILIANRGEIARRVARTAHDLGIEVVAVYAADDASAPHVLAADRALRLDGSTVSTTYLDPEQLLAAARKAGVDAVHPGYGFLSEDFRFAQACVDAGLVFVGPDPEVIRAMGLKDEAKRLARAAGLPVLPEADVRGDDPSGWRAAAESVGYPVIVKAVAGGGGRAMHAAYGPDELDAAVLTTRREAGALFGNDHAFLERYLTAPRHIEVQVAGDAAGGAVHLFERDCSVQRRHQKVIEEAPAPFLSPSLRARICDAAVALVRKLRYQGVGTVEFLVEDRADDPAFYFVEMNPRIQVEHPVTEEVVGIDLVRLQLQLAMGMPLSLTQESVVLDGHAVEARVYAERPEAGFAPSPGLVHRYDHPQLAGVRFEDGVVDGSLQSAAYDPMLGKVVAHGSSRSEALARLVDALQRLRIHGVASNRDFLVSILTDPAFAGGEARTDFLDSRPELAARPHGPTTLQHLAALVAHRAFRDPGRSHLPSSRSGGGSLPVVWSPPELLERVDQDPGSLVLSHRWEGPAEAGRLVLRVDDEQQSFGVSARAGGPVRVEFDGIELPCEVSSYADGTFWVNDHRWQTGWRFGRVQRREVEQSSSGDIVMSIPGTVISAVAVGTLVAAGDQLMLLEAMKLQHVVTAPVAGRVAETREPGTFVQTGEVAVRVDPDTRA